MSELPSKTIDIETEFTEIVRKQFPEQAYTQPDGTLGYRPAVSEGYLLGSPDYPVAAYREMIFDSVKQNLITIITAKTGTGKSTNVPQYLFEGKFEPEGFEREENKGFERVIVTQPRILAARELKTHVASDIADSIHNREHKLAGYQTAMEGDSQDDNAILYVTDGLQLMREIMGQGVQKDQVLVIDEYHERSSNMDALLAVAVEFGIRVVIMSATLDAEGLSKHYEGVTGKPVPVIDIPGVMHEVIESEADDLDNAIVEQAKNGKNILVFLPGRKEINMVKARMARRVPNTYTLLELDGDQPPDVQRRVMGAYEGGKIIFSTSVGQTSITIPDIDVVIDCGYERTMMLDEKGKDDLATQLASRATSDQRRGRVGRTKPGEYIRAALRGFPPLPSPDKQASFDMPEIRRVQLQDLQLKLAAFGHSVLTLPFYEQPSEVEIERSSQRLERLQFFRKVGKTALDGYKITEMGRLASRLPLDAHSARMVIESRKYGSAVELQMMAAAAVAQLRGITHTAKGMENWRKLTKDKTSDVIAGIDYMVGALQRTESEQSSSHIVKTRYDKAFRAFEQLAKRRNLDIYDLTKPDDQQREALLRSIIAGASELYTLSGKSYVDVDQKRRRPVNSSIIAEGSPLLVGTSLGLQQVRRKVIKTNPLITAASAVDIATLQDVIPERVTTVIQKLFVSEDGIPRTIEEVYFDGRATKYKVEGDAKPSAELQKFMIEHILSNKSLGGKQGENIKAARRAIADMRYLQHKTTEDLGIDHSLKHDIVPKMLKESNYYSVTFNEVDPFINIEEIENIVPKEIRDEIEADAPEVITIVVDKREVRLKVTYHDNNAYITTQPRFYMHMPYAIADKHKVYVKATDAHTDYMSLGKAQAAYKLERSFPARQVRRGNEPEDKTQADKLTRNTKEKSSPRIQPSQRPSTTRRSR